MRVLRTESDGNVMFKVAISAGGSMPANLARCMTSDRSPLVLGVGMPCLRRAVG